MNQWIDIHTHLNMLKETPDEAIMLAKAVGVERLITIGTEPADHPLVLDFAQKYFPVVSCTLGVHPNDADKYSSQVLKDMESHLSKPYVVAVGEIGLDFYREHDKKQQEVAFHEQLELAISHHLPVQIHTRDAEDATIQILKSYAGKITGVVHCFTGTDFLAQEALKLGLDISVSGIVTFKNAKELQSVVQKIPLEKMHIETDSPFLSPVPHRGKPNMPAYVVHTAAYLAEMKQVSLNDFCKQMHKNALRLFPKLDWA